MNVLRKLRGVEDDETLEQIVAADPGLARAESKLTELRTRRDAEQRERVALLTRIELAKNPAGHDPLTEAALLLLDGKPSVAADVNHADRLGEARTRCQILDRAIELQEKLIEGERERLSKVASERAAERHRAIVQHIGKALTELSSALAQEERLRDEFRSAGVRCGLWPGQFPHAAAMRLDQTEYETMAQRWFVEAREQGLL